MLVLTRKLNEVINIGDDIEIMVTKINRRACKLGITAPKSAKVLLVKKPSLAPVEDAAKPFACRDCGATFSNLVMRCSACGRFHVGRVA